MKKLPFLAIFTILALVLSAGNSLSLKIASFSTDIEPPDFSYIGLSKDKADNYEYYVVQFDSRIMPWNRTELEAAGAEIFDYIPNDALIIRVSNDIFDAVSSVKGIHFMQIWQPAYRIEPSILTEEHRSTPDEEPGILALNVALFASGDIEATADAIRSINGAELLESGEVMVVRTDEAHFRNVAAQIASLKDVYWVERAFPELLHNTWSRWILDSFDTLNMKGGKDAWNAAMTIADSTDSLVMPMYAHGLYGQNQIIGDDDTGLDWDNVYFRDETYPVLYDPDTDTICENPSSNHRKIVSYCAYADTYDMDVSGHGTHTCGSAAGDSLGTGLPSATSLSRGAGMAPLARLAFYDIGTSGGYLSIPSNYGYVYRWMYNAGARITTSSWGQGSGGYSSYTIGSRYVDFVAWDHKDIIMFRSAGNSNNDAPADSVNSPATAKNIVTVGASESGSGTITSWTNPGGGSRNELLDVAEFSSHGPTREGQMKPELMGTGGWYIFSANSDGNLGSNNNDITYMGGTSMSTPTVAGFGALVRQYFTEGWYPTGTLNGPDAFTPSGALIKAMMVNATRNSPGNYSTSTLANSGQQNAPSMGQGWGRVTMSDAIYFAGDTRDLLVYDETTGFASADDYDEYTFFTGPSTDEYIKIVLTWTDYPAGTSPAIVVVNDLDLTVFTDMGTYNGNMFGDNARSIESEDRDSLNVTEVVWLDPIPNSSVTVRVTAENIPNPSQPYALVITGDIGSEPGPGVNYTGCAVLDTLSSGTVKQDNALNNGETAQLEISVANSSGGSVTGVTGLLQSDASFCTVLDSTAVYGDMADNDTISALYRVSVAGSAEDNAYIPFRLITSYGSELDTTYFSLQIAGTNIISVSADSLLFDYTVKATGSASVFVKHADSTSVKAFNITNASMKNAASWVTDVAISSSNVAPGDSSAITVTVDTTGLSPLTRYEDTLVISTDADSSKAVAFNIPVILMTSDMLGINAGNSLPVKTGFTLKSNINAYASGVFALAKTGDVSMDIIDITGRRISTIHSGVMQAGYYNIQWNGTDSFGNNVHSGIYFMRISADKNITEKIIIVR